MVLWCWAVLFVLTTLPLVHLVTMILLEAVEAVEADSAVVAAAEGAVVEGSMTVEAAGVVVVDVEDRPTAAGSVTSKVRR